MMVSGGISMNRLLHTLMVCLLVGVVAGCTVATDTPVDEPVVEPTTDSVAGMANPASENCVAVGGTLAIEERGDLGQIGVCYFEDIRQCEEWALMRGDCPAGGVKVTGYVTEAGRYCAITGGTYTVTGDTAADPEQGTCTFADGSQCDAWDYYNGICSPGTPAPTTELQTFFNNEAGFNLQAPAAWTQTTLPDQNNGMIHGQAFTGPEGGVEVYWGVGFGGACPAGYTTVLLAQGEAQTCYTKRDDGTELWDQIAYQVEGGNSFSSRAYTSNAEPASHDLVLQVLSTLAFILPEQPFEGQAIQPLSMELCNGQAQAMSHFLNDMIPTVTDEPLSDPGTGASGTGCQSTITGTGADFESPSAVVEVLRGMLEEQGWTEDPMGHADGPTGTLRLYRKDDQICYASAIWFPDDSANCPDDQPITTCQLTPEQQNYTVTLNCGAN
jgi:putative hemolysin